MHHADFIGKLYPSGESYVNPEHMFALSVIIFRVVSGEFLLVSVLLSFMSLFVPFCIDSSVDFDGASSDGGEEKNSAYMGVANAGNLASSMPLYGDEDDFGGQCDVHIDGNLDDDDDFDV